MENPKNTASAELETPFSVDHSAAPDEPPVIRDGAGRVVCEIEPHDDADATAGFVARACTFHGPLLAACEDALYCLNELKMGGLRDGRTSYDVAASLGRLLREVKGPATGEPTLPKPGRCLYGRELPPSGGRTRDICFVIDDAEEAFGQTLVRHFPDATTGDLSPERTMMLREALERAVEEWIGNNVVDHGRDETLPEDRHGKAE